MDTADRKGQYLLMFLRRGYFLLFDDELIALNIMIPAAGPPAVADRRRLLAQVI
jgi:hypothetical protein